MRVNPTVLDAAASVSPIVDSGVDGQLLDETPRLGPRSTIAYVPGLDGLRGISVLAVMFVHSELAANGGGVAGVDVFFVLSGFLITRILVHRTDEEGRVPLRYFYERRARRILPALWTLFAVLTIVVVLDSKFDRPEQYYHSLGLASVFMTHVQWGILHDHPGTFAHLWSLGWEENFYVVWPLMFAFVGRRSRRALMAVLLFGVCVLQVVRLGSAITGLSVPHLLKFAAQARADAILLGCLLGLVLPSTCAGVAERSKAGPVSGLVAVAVLLAIFGAPIEFLDAGAYSIVSLATGFVVVQLNRGQPSLLVTVLESRFVRRTGLLSYGLYLWHVPIFHWLRSHGFSARTVAVVGFVSTFSVALLSYVTVEKWFSGKRRSPRDKANPERQHGVLRGEVDALATAAAPTSSKGRVKPFREESLAKVTRVDQGADPSPRALAQECDG